MESTPLCFINELKKQQNINMFQEFINPFTPSFWLTPNISRKNATNFNLFFSLPKTYISSYINHLFWMLIHHRIVCAVAKYWYFWIFLVKNLVFRDPLKRSSVTMATGKMFCAELFLWVSRVVRCCDESLNKICDYVCQTIYSKTFGSYMDLVLRSSA